MRVEIGGVALRFGVAAAAFCACILNYGSARLFWFGALAVMLHESTHLLLMLYFGCRRITVEVLPGGVRIQSDDLLKLGYRQTGAVFFIAPLANLAACAVFFLCSRWVPDPVLRQNAAVHLALGGVNLLPLSFLDGGRTLRCLLASLRGSAADAWAKGADAACLLLLAAALLLLALLRIFPVPLYVFCLYCGAMTFFSGRQRKG